MVTTGDYSPMVTIGAADGYRSIMSMVTTGDYSPMVTIGRPWVGDSRPGVT